MPKTILIIDDEPAVLEVVARLVENEGYDVVTAHSGDEGLSVLGHRNFDLIITDLMMPGISGWQVLEAAKQQYPNIKVVVFTGYVDEEGEAILMDRHADGFLTKPLDIPVMRSLLTSLLLADEVIGAHVVAVDDDRVILKRLESTLATGGMSVEAFTSPAEGLAHALKSPPHVFLVDLDMPEITGFDLVGKIRDHDHLKAIPIIILTGLAERTVVARALEMGIQGFVKKPFETDLLIEKVKKVILASRASQ